VSTLLSLDHLPVAALLIHQHSGCVEASNLEWLDLWGANTDGLPPLGELIRLEGKQRCPLCETGTLAPDQTLPQYHGGMLQRPQGEAMKVKIKHRQLPENRVLVLIEPFAEDVALTQAHSDFVSTVSHEFRTPLTSIKGFADTMLRYGAQLPPEQHRRFINIIKDQADRLSRLVENLLTVSKLGAQRVELIYRPVSVQRMIDKVTQSLRGKSDTPRQFEVNIAPNLPEVWVDTDRFEQILLNLVDNAIKYSYPDTTVFVDARLLSDERVEITVKDQGVGIPAEHLPRIFTQFSRIDNPLTRQVEGTGLGLYITQSLTLSMQGTIAVTSQVNEGTTFTLTFPVATAELQSRGTTE
jgi:signal transduction histidine kinase